MSKWFFCALMALGMVWANGVVADEGGGAPESAVTSLQDADFPAFIQDGYAVVDFFADWCPPCRRTLPEFEKVAQEMGEQARFGKLDVDGSMTAPKLGVKVIPTLIVFKDGEEVARRTGGADADTIQKFVTQAMEKSS